MKILVNISILAKGTVLLGRRRHFTDLPLLLKRALHISERGRFASKSDQARSVAGDILLICRSC